jgi:DNA polymerase III subunit delta
MGLKELKSKIAGGKAIPAVVLLGADSYLRELCRNALIDTYVPESARDWALGRLSARGGKNWLEVFERAQTLPMLSPRQVLIVEDLEAIEDLGDKARDAAVDALDKYLADPAPFTVLVFEAAQLDKRLRLYKALSKNSKTLIVELVMDPAQAEELAVATAREQGVHMDREAAALLVDAVNVEPARIRTEVEKLSLYAQQSKKITTHDVESLVLSARKYTVWQLAEMIAGSRREAALEFLDAMMREGEQPAALVGGLAWMYRKLIEVREFPRHTDIWRLCGELKMNEESARIAQREAPRFSRAQLLEGLAALSEADSQLKSGIKDARAALEFLITQLTAKSQAATAAR